jgi:hypothetical protein
METKQDAIDRQAGSACRLTFVGFIVARVINSYIIYDSVQLTQN